MLNAIAEEADGSVSLVVDDDDPWADEPTRVIPNEELEVLLYVTDPAEERPTARMKVVTQELLAAGSMTELPSAAVCAEVRSFPRATEPSVTFAPAAHAHRGAADRAWLIALGLAMLAVEIVALGF